MLTCKKASVLTSAWISVLALSATVSVVGCANDPGRRPPTIVQSVEAARTRTDHDFIKNYYLREAAVARAAAHTHRQLVSIYEEKGTLRGGRGLPEYSNAVAGLLDALAVDFENMAAEHQRLAWQLLR